MMVDNSFEGYNPHLWEHWLLVDHVVGHAVGYVVGRAVGRVAQMDRVVAEELQLVEASVATVVAPVVLRQHISVARLTAVKAELRIMDFLDYQKVVTAAAAAVVVVEIVGHHLEMTANATLMAGEEEAVVAVDVAVSLHSAYQMSVETVQDMVVVGLGIAVTVEKQFVVEAYVANQTVVFEVVVYSERRNVAAKKSSLF